jgi:hypothetical protein
VKPAQHRISGVALVAAILASPLGWVDYTLLLLPVFLSRHWTWPWWCAALMLVTFMGDTWWMLSAPHWVLATLGQYATVALLMVLVGLLQVPGHIKRLSRTCRQVGNNRHQASLPCQTQSTLLTEIELT